MDISKKRNLYGTSVYYFMVFAVIVWGIVTFGILNIFDIIENLLDSVNFNRLIRAWIAVGGGVVVLLNIGKVVDEWFQFVKNTYLIIGGV